MRCCGRGARRPYLQTTVKRFVLACWLAQELVLVRRACASASLLSAASLAMCASCTSLARPSCHSSTRLGSDRGCRASLADLMLCWRLAACRGVPNAPLLPFGTHLLQHDLPRQGEDSKASQAHQHGMGLCCRNGRIGHASGKA